VRRTAVISSISSFWWSTAEEISSSSFAPQIHLITILPATSRVAWPTTVRSSPTPVSDNCVLPTLWHSLSVGRAAVLKTGPLPPQDHKSGTVCHPISDYVGCHGQFRRLLKTLLFGQWGHGAVWTFFNCAEYNYSYLLTYYGIQSEFSVRRCLTVLFCVADTREFDQKIEAYKQCLQQMPAVNHATLKQLVFHLSRSELFSYSRAQSSGVITDFQLSMLRIYGIDLSWMCVQGVPKTSSPPNKIC